MDFQYFQPIVFCLSMFYLKVFDYTSVKFILALNDEISFLNLIFRVYLVNKMMMQ